jgi:hypothetical protein
MYRACLFCNADLGLNQAVEHFPVGRRLAFDQGRGRLWVVCRKCERWNLTPLDDRWEAMEECEKLFRDTRLRFSTDEIGLARLTEGTELVRIGEPLRPEFAAWRYGDQFGRRRRRHLLMVGAGIVGVAGVVVLPKLLLGIGGGGFGYNFINPALQAYKAKKTVAQLPLEGGETAPVTQLQIERTRLLPGSTPDTWRLHIPERGSWRDKPRIESVPRSGILLEGEMARTALQKILPRANRQGAGRESVQTAVRALEETPTTDAMIAMLARGPVGAWKQKKGHDRTLHTLKSELRLALEMTTHEEAERRWLAGELLELEQAWRQAEEIAEIADKLGIPADVEARLEAMRSAHPRTREKGEP